MDSTRNTEIAVRWHDGLTPQGKLDVLQAAMMGLPQAPTEIRHHFTPGLYAREMRAKRGTVLLSKLHKTEHPFVLSAGRLTIWTEERGLVTLRAPYFGVTKAGTRRLAYVHEAVVWTTFHATAETDLEKIEADVIEAHDVQPLPEIEGLRLLSELMNEMEAKV